MSPKANFGPSVVALVQGLSRTMFKAMVLSVAVSSVSFGSVKLSTLSSPNGKVQVDFSVAASGDHAGAPVYSVRYDGQPVIGESLLGLELKEGSALSGLQIESSNQAAVDSTYTLPVGKNETIRDHYNETTFHLVEQGSPHRILEITFRLYDDGVGFRYNLPRQDAISSFAITKEDTSFNLQNDPKLYAVELPFNSSFEGLFSQGPLQNFVAEKTMILPVMAGSTTGPWVGITEAGLYDYSGLYLTHTAASTLEARLAPSLKDPSILVVGTTPFATPWRVLLIGTSGGDLLNSNIVSNLNEPTAIADTSWIHPGKIVFPWWNGYNLPTAAGDQDPTHKPGLNTFSLKRYIDFCVANGIEYYSFDGYDQAWYGGDISNPPANSDVTKSIPQIDMQEVLNYGKQYGVRARLWMHQQALADAPDMDKVFATYESWGIEGIMLDFLNRDDQEMVQFYTRIIQGAAKHHLSVNFHGVWKPTGLTRTYPNLFSQEAVRSSEYNRFQPEGSPPEHEMIYAYVRQIAGPLDVHPGSFHPVAPENWSLQKYPLNAMGTLARQLAIYVVMESGIQMVVDAPLAYLAHPESFDFVKEVPANWNETRVLSGQVGEDITTVRRHGQQWFLGSMTNRNARSEIVPLAFLGEGSFNVEIYNDGADPKNNPEEVIVQRRVVTAADTLTLQLGPSGGAAAHFSPVK